MLDYQHQVNGLLMGRDTVYILEEITGLGTGPKDERRYKIAGADGVAWGRERRYGNIVTFEGKIHTSDAATAYTALLALRAAFDASALRAQPRATVAYTYKWPGQAETTVQGRPGEMTPSMRNLIFGIVPFTATFEVKVPLTT